MDSLGWRAPCFIPLLQEIVQLCSWLLHSAPDSKEKSVLGSHVLTILYRGSIWWYPAEIPSRIIQAQIIHCDVYSKLKNMHNSTPQVICRRGRRALRTGEPGLIHSPLVCPHTRAGDVGHALGGHLALKFPSQGPGQLMCCRDSEHVLHTVGNKQLSNKNCK